MNEHLCVFVCSSDNTHDVFEATRERLVQTWPLSIIPAYVGTNTRTIPAPWQAVRAPASEWRTELLQQILALPEQVEQIVLILDDFFFHRAVPLGAIQRYAQILHHLQGDYLRLRPVERAMLPSLVRRWRRYFGLLPEVERLGQSEPYYSSLQVAIWNRAYLAKRLSGSGNIWAFEHEVPPDSRHFAITTACLDYDHLVEKGKWYRSAPSLLNLPITSPVFKRGFESDPFKNSKRYNRLKFMVLGYSVFRVRRFLSSRAKP